MRKGAGAAGRMVSIGECMVELRPSGDGGIVQSFAGDSLNTAYYARLFSPPGWTVDYVSAIGTDGLSLEMERFIGQNGIGTAGIRRLTDMLPGLYMIHLDKGERSFSYWRSNAAARRLADDADWLEEAIGVADAIFFSGITLAILPPLGRRNLLRVLREARLRGCTIAFDPNIRARLWEDAETLHRSISQAASVSNLLLPSFDDEKLHFGDPDPQATIARYQALGVDRVVVKNGNRDIVMSDHGVICRIEAMPVVAVVDSTSAGDSFNGAFLARFTALGSSVEAAQHAAHVASIVIGHHGALVEPAALSMLPGFNPPTLSRLQRVDDERVEPPRH